MATWRDGPEYAPAARPTAFVEPSAPPLSPPQTPPSAPEVDRSEQPSFDAPEQDTPDLATLIPATAPTRDPKLAFEVVTAAITNSTAWGAAHMTAPAPTGAPIAPAPGPAWSPQQPFNPGTPVSGSIPAPPPAAPRPSVNPQQFPAPGTPQWFSPPAADQRYQAPPTPVRILTVLQAVTPAVLIALVIGGLFEPLSVLLLFISYALATRIGYRRVHVRRLFFAAIGVVGFFGVASWLIDRFYWPSFWSAASGAARWMCWLLAMGLCLIVAFAMSKGEKEEQP